MPHKRSLDDGKLADRSPQGCNAVPAVSFPGGCAAFLAPLRFKKQRCRRPPLRFGPYRCSRRPARPCRSHRARNGAAHIKE
jgi:hypothetical protein